MTERAHKMNEEITVNADGGAQSKLHIRPRLVPPEALKRISEVVAAGADRYAENNWRKIPYEDHLDHALAHLFELLDGDKTDDHLGHAFCRLGMAIAMEKPDFDFKQYRPLTEKSNG